MVASTRQLAVPEALVSAFESFVRRQIPLEDLHALVAEIVSTQPAYVESIQAMFDRELENQRLTIADYGELVVELGEVLSEDVATDCSAIKPDESGVYRIVGGGQMVPDETDVQPILNRATEVAEPAWSAEVAAADQPLAAENPAADSVVTTGHVLRERFRLEKELGSGSMGVVYRATDLLLEESGVTEHQLAVKVIRPELSGNVAALRALQNEIIASQRLSHPNIIHLYDFDRDGDISFLTMELLLGETLAKVLDDAGAQPLDAEFCDHVIQQLGDALTYAHRQGVVHADLKPGNVFLCDSGEIKLLDFGVAQISHTLRDQADLLEGVLTPAYASCERLEYRKASPRDDVYSFACIVYRMLVGRRPFGTVSALEAESAQMSLLPDSSIPRHRFPVLRRSLAFRADSRPASVADFVADYFSPDSLEPEPPVLTDKPDFPAFEEQVEPVESVFDNMPPPEPGVHEFPAANVSEPDTDSAAASVAVLETSPSSDAAVQSVADTDDEAARRPFLRSRKNAAGLAEQPELQARIAAKDPVGTGNRVRNIRRKTLLLARSIGYQLTANSTRFAMLAVFSGIAAAAFVSLTYEPELKQLAGVELDPTPVSMLVLPTEDSILVVPDDFYAAVKPQQRATRSASRPARQRPAAPQPEPARRAGTITVIPEPAPGPTRVPEPTRPVVAAAVGAEMVEPSGASDTVPVVTTVDSSVVVSAVVTDVKTDVIGRDVEQTFVTNVESDLAAQNLASVVTTVNRRGARAVPESIPPIDTSESLPLSALSFERFVEPDFPSGSLSSVDNWVDVNFGVDEEGRTTDVQIVDSSLPRRYTRAAVNAVKKWRFEPYRQNGAAVAVKSEVRLRVE